MSVISLILALLSLSSVTAFDVPLPLENVPILKSEVMKISDFTHPRYGQWLTKDEIQKMTTPTKVPSDLEDWVSQNGINCEQCDDMLTCQGDPTTFPPPPEPYFVSGYLRSPFSRPTFKTKSRSDPGTQYVVPQTLASFYNVPTGHHAKVSVGPVEFQNYGAFTYDDAASYEEQVGVPLVYPTPDHIIGPFGNESAEVESSLDFDVISGLAPGATSWYWTEPYWIYDWAHNMFLADDVPQVVSLSWGWSEDAQCDIMFCNNSYAYVNRSNDELLRLAARGITVIIASGDAGSPGRTSENCDNGVHADFPGGSPWVTTIGATSLRNPTPLERGPPFCQNNTCLGGGEEGMCFLHGPGGCFWTGGGGISNATRVPWYQEKQVRDYVSDGSVPKPPHYRKDGRGYPDAAVMGHDYFVMVNGQVQAVDGTSASAPAFAAMVARMNADLVASGKPVLGFVTPLLYHLGENCDGCFNSIDTGNNNCTEQKCCPYGYSARKGVWDAVTGWGSPNVGNILEYIN